MIQAKSTNRQLVAIRRVVTLAQNLLPGTWLVATLAISAVPLSAQYAWSSARPDGHAPIGVMQDHAHESGEFMLAYRYMQMSMEGNRINSDRVGSARVLQDFMVSPVEMPMQMSMIEGMYAPSDRITLAVMLPFIVVDMEHVTRTGGSFTTEGSGFGDVTLAAMVGLNEAGGPFRAHLNAGLSVPTGSIDITDVTPMSNGNRVQLPYPMQTGSGTWDLKPGVTVLWMNPGWSWGAQGMAVLRLGENTRQYTLGNRFEATSWLARRLNDWWSLSARGALTTWANIEGADPAGSVNPVIVPTARTDLRAGTRLDVPLGINFAVPTGAFRGHRIGVELHIPVYQHLHGPQLETDRVLTIGWQKSFN